MCSSSLISSPLSTKPLFSNHEIGPFGNTTSVDATVGMVKKEELDAHGHGREVRFESEDHPLHEHLAFDADLGTRSHHYTQHQEQVGKRAWKLHHPKCERTGGRKLYSGHCTSRPTIRLRKGLNEIKQGGSPHRRQTPQRRPRIRFPPKGNAFREVFRLRS